MPSRDKFYNMNLKELEGKVSGAESLLISMTNNPNARYLEAEEIFYGLAEVLLMRQQFLEPDGIDGHQDQSSAEVISTIVNDTTPGLLIHIVERLRCMSSSSGQALSACVPRIMMLELKGQELIFKRITKKEQHALFGTDRKVDDKQKNASLDKGMFGIAHHLYQLKVKANALQDRKKDKAYTAANDLHSELSTCFNLILPRKNRHLTKRPF